MPSLIADPALETEMAAMTTPMEGDVVQLKSGGPKMTVDGLSDEAGRVQAKCSWFNDGIRMSDLFEFHSLRNLEDGVPKASLSAGCSISIRSFRRLRSPRPASLTTTPLWSAVRWGLLSPARLLW